MKRTAVAEKLFQISVYTIIVSAVNYKKKVAGVLSCDLCMLTYNVTKSMLIWQRKDVQKDISTYVQCVAVSLLVYKYYFQWIRDKLRQVTLPTITVTSKKC